MSQASFFVFLCCWLLTRLPPSPQVGPPPPPPRPALRSLFLTLLCRIPPGDFFPVLSSPSARLISTSLPDAADQYPHIPPFLSPAYTTRAYSIKSWVGEQEALVGLWSCPLPWLCQGPSLFQMRTGHVVLSGVGRNMRVRAEWGWRSLS